MFLNRLEVVGFKSFAERIHIDFVSGITAVVGPNGSGKSNIIDAIRWVLGEQSAKSLRGQKMEDIIFQGSDTRNPLNFAEVSLILNNEASNLPIDYNEVSITRRVYRSGESEFLINKQPCRLKDIVDLFTDTGLGRESFSIIGQGKIDEILSSKADERRAIFEEAAGVLKYKQRKNKAVYKLEETEDNLDRVEDIIHEIEQQLDPLQKQAEIAKKYKERRNELKNIEIALLVTEIEQLNEQWKALLAKIEEDKLIEIKQKTTIQDKEADIAKRKHTLHQLDNEITETHQKLLKATEKLEQYEGKRNVFHERQKHFTENKLSLETSQATLTAKITELKNERNTENEKKTRIGKEIVQLKEQIEVLENNLRYGAERLSDQIENLKADYIEFLNERAVLQNEEQSIQKQIKQLQNMKQDQKDRNKSFLEKKAQLESEKSLLEEKISRHKEEISQTELKLERSKEDLAKERNKYDNMQEKLYKGNEQIATLTSRKETLEEMKKSFQGYFYGVKEILKANQKGTLKNIYGTVVDIIDVPSKYVAAIDTILGGQAQHIVVPNDDVARQAIYWLKKENKGRATFLPIQSLSERAIPSSTINQLKSHQGFINIAANIVNTDTQFEKVIHHLMGNVIVADTLQHANEIAKLTNRRYRIVTLEGDVVYPGGSMSGGAKRQTNQSLFTREKELTALKEKLTEFKIRAKDYSDKVMKQRDFIEEMVQKQFEIEEAISVSKEELQKFQSDHHEVSINLTNTLDDLTSYHLNMKQYEENMEQYKHQQGQVVVQLDSLKEKIKATETSIEELTEKEQQLKDSERNTERQLHELQIKMAELEERKKNFEEKIAHVNDRILQHKEEKTQVDEQLKELLDEKKLEESEQVLTEQINETKALREAAQTELEEKRNYRQTLTQTIEDEERELKQQEKIHEKMVKEIQEKEVQATRLDVALENNLTHLQTEYVMTFERAAELHDRVENMEEARQKVKQIKLSIDSLGTVNLGAIDEYDRLLQRHSFLMEQKQDLLEAKNTLFAVIDEMDEEMIKRFGEMFAQIQVAFTDVFKKLFGGGDAQLVLTDETNLLETGIEIMARPPGKKQKALSLLSGGERALTAIALLFAILKVKPVPFCILDEVDASLDETNVIRFSNYLNSYSEGTQFIVITHRKGTMEEADVLYGVTMQESGVSRLVSVRLEETSELVEVP